MTDTKTDNKTDKVVIPPKAAAPAPKVEATAETASPAKVLEKAPEPEAPKVKGRSIPERTKTEMEAGKKALGNR